MNMTDNEIEAAVHAYREEHGKLPTPTSFASSLGVGYYRAREAINQAKITITETPPREAASPIPDEVQKAFQAAWKCASQHAAANFEVARQDFDKKLAALGSERDELVEAFDKTGVDLAAMTCERDWLLEELAELQARVVAAEERAKAAELRAAALLEAMQASRKEMVERVS